MARKIRFRHLVEMSDKYPCRQCTSLPIEKAVMTEAAIASPCGVEAANDDTLIRLPERAPKARLAGKGLASTSFAPTWRAAISRPSFRVDPPTYRAAWPSRI